VARNREEAFERFSRIVDGPMMVLALAMIPLIVVPVVVDLPPGLDRAFVAVDYLVWVAFALEYAIKLYLAPDRWRFFKRNLPDLIIVAVPMLRPLRVLRSVRLLRLLRLARLVAFATEGVGEARSILRRRGLSWVLLIVLVVNLVAAALVLTFERDMPNGNIHNYPDALWWAVTTITTVGYGDRFPMSAAGRGVAVVLMVSGIALFGIITASIAAYFVEQQADQQDQDVADRLDRVLDRLDAIEAKLSMGRAGGGSEVPDEPDVDGSGSSAGIGLVHLDQADAELSRVGWRPPNSDCSPELDSCRNLTISCCLSEGIFPNSWFLPTCTG
jgi:voltage-gated potassium channel